MEIKIHTVHEHHIPVNAVSGEKDRSTQTHINSQRDRHTHTQMTLAETY